MNPTVEAIATVLLVALMLTVALAAYIAALPLLVRLRHHLRAVGERAGTQEFR